MAEDKQWDCFGLINMADAQTRIEKLGWRITGIEVALKDRPEIRMIIPTPALLQESSQVVEDVLKEAERVGRRVLENMGGNGEGHEPTIH